MRRRKMTLTGLTLLLALTSLSFKCGGQGGNADPKRTYVKAGDDIAGAISAMIDAKRSLRRQQLITVEEDIRLTQLLTVANDADIAFVNRLKSTTAVNASVRNDLLNLLAQVTAAVDNLKNSGVLRLGNPNASRRLSRFINTISPSLVILNQIGDCHEIPPNCYQCGNGPVICPDSRR